MPNPVTLSKSDVRRAMVRHHFAPCATMDEAFERLRSVQFDPIAPVGCNHDLVLQGRVEGYRVGDWETLAYRDRRVYDGWDKQASLVPFAGWSLRRVVSDAYRRAFDERIFKGHREAVDLILGEIAARGPLLPRECEFQMRREEWKDHWYGPSVTKQVLRALWHSGLVMTAGRRNGQHLYDLPERVVPPEFLNEPRLPDADALREIMMDRHRALGIVRPTASFELWGFRDLYLGRKPALAGLLHQERIVPVEVEGAKAHADPAFLALLDQPALEPRVRFVAPLDGIMWDRKLVAHVFGFDYIWEIYKPESQRRWGYYVLPVLFGNAFVARAEFFCRSGVLELRRWHSETDLPPAFFPELERALARFMAYCGAATLRPDPSIDPKIRDLLGGAGFGLQGCPRL